MSLRYFLSVLVLTLLWVQPLHAAGHDAIVTFANGLRAAVYQPPDYAKADPKKRWPALFFSHGFAGSALSQDVLLGKIAALGILVLAVEHSDPVAFERIPPREGDSRWKILSYLRDHPFDDATYGYRPQEFAVFVREAMGRFPIDERRIIFAGHSMGGYTIFNALRQVEEQPCALIAYSTGELNFKRGRPYFTPAQLAAIKVPLLLTYGEHEFDADRGPYAQVIKRDYGGPVQLMMVQGGSHLSYNDPARAWGKRKRLAQIAQVFARSRQFLQAVLPPQ
jgi:pimeloyl-ACP methyl ester carboxylesterase